MSAAGSVGSHVRVSAETFSLDSSGQELQASRHELLPVRAFLCEVFRLLDALLGSCWVDAQVPQAETEMEDPGTTRDTGGR